jgi:hypothetical protein
MLQILAYADTPKSCVYANHEQLTQTREAENADEQNQGCIPTQPAESSASDYKVFDSFQDWLDSFTPPENMDEVWLAN